jgi:putative restriction endonuclease
VNLSEAISRLYDLRPGTTPVEEGSPHERPHKPLLLLAAFDLIDEGLATPERIPWSQELRDRFSSRFVLVRRHNDQDTPENPFFYLQSQGFWKAWTESGLTQLPLQTTPLVGQMNQIFARFADGFELLAALPECRQQMRESLVARYFPWAAEALLSIRPLQSEETVSPNAAEEEAGYGRSPAFRRTILTIYDHQCAACGLRIRLPAGADVSFFDAAHLIPWSHARNDHPTNGLALCKNHHWALDRNLIAPAPDHQWKVSPVIDARRSNGEKELRELNDKTLLLPKDPAFHPDTKGLEWRVWNLVA